MRYIKNTLVVTAAIISLLLSVKSSYALEAGNTIKSITPTTTQSLTLEVAEDTLLQGDTITGDVKIYQDIHVISATKGVEDSKKVIIQLDTELQKDASYSILSIAGAEGSMEFTFPSLTPETEVANATLDASGQGIAKVTLKDPTTLELTFSQNIVENDFEFKFYKDTPVKSITVWKDTKTFEISLGSDLLENSNYVGTLTYLEDEGNTKVDIENGIYDFKTATLTAAGSSTGWEKSLEESLLSALEESAGLNGEATGGELLDSEKEMQNALNSASEDPKNAEPTQLENMALSQNQTPDTGAETWVLILGTLIINTFYYLARRKRA